jgi:hypothetical protein
MRVLAWVLVALGVYELYANVLGYGGSGAAHGCHLGGALWGYLAHRHRLEPARLLDSVAAWRERRAASNQAEQAEILDRLLEKVQREGLPSLTPAERRFLDRQSRDRRAR